MKTKFRWLALFVVLSLASCEIKKTEEGKMPEVEVDTEAGKLPDYKVDWADVDVGTTTRTVKVPKVVVVMEEREVKVPYIDVKMPNDTASGRTTTEREERTLAVEAQVHGESHELNIEEVYATDNRLYVISRLTPTGQDLQNETMQVSDQIVVNVPEDMNVKYYIIGKKPDGNFFNTRYTYISSREEIADKLQGGKTIYSRS
ncbi:MAG: hypothetical protein ACK4TA_01570 [Saprospiraceae bacterium]